MFSNNNEVMSYGNDYVQMAAYEGDFNGDGHKNEIAVLEAYRPKTESVYDNSVYKLRVAVIDGTNPYSAYYVIDEDVGEMIGDISEGISFNQLQQNLHIATGDYNGDGVDEIFVLTSQFTGGQPILFCYNLKTEATADAYKTAGNWFMRYLDDKLTDDYHFGRGATHALAVGDLNRDGCADIAWTSTYLHAVAGHSATENTTRIVFGDAGYPSNVINTPRKIITVAPATPAFANETSASYFPPNTLDPRRAQHTVAIADVDGNPGNELMIGFTYQGTSQGTSKGANVAYGYGIEVMSYDYSNGSMYRVPGADNRPYFHVRSDITADVSPMYGVKVDPDTAAPLAIAAGDFFGANQAPAVMVNGELYRYVVTDEVSGYEWVYTGTYGVGAGEADYRKAGVGLRWTFFSARPMTLNGSEYGFIYHCANEPGGDAHIYAIYGKSGPGGISVEDINASTGGRYFDAERPTFFALPDTDHDSVILEYVGYHLLYSDPTVVAALASPPYYKELEHLPGGTNYVYNSATSIGSSHGSGAGTSKSSTYSVGAYVSIEVQIGPKFARGVVETEVAYNHGWVEEMEEIATTTETITYTNYGGQDSVVLITLPIDVYQYNLYYPVDEAGTTYDSTEYTVVFPYSTVSTMVPLDTYNSIQKDYSEILPDIDRDVFTHTVGYPKTYTVSDAKLHSAYVSEPIGAPSATTAITKTLTIVKTAEKSTISTNSVDVKAGGGFASKVAIFEGKITAGMSFGYEDARGKITVETNGTEYSGTVGGIPVAARGYNYNYDWRLVQYEYVGLQNFPVVTYKVENERSPAPLPNDYWVQGVTTDSVTLAWTPAAGDNLNQSAPSIEYKIYRVFTGGSYAERENPTIIYDEHNGIYTYTETGLPSGVTFDYVITSRRTSEPGSSVYSDVLHAMTYPTENIGSFSASPPESLTLYPDLTGQNISATYTTEPPGGNVSYKWQKRSGVMWADVAANADGITGAAANTLVFVEPQSANAGEYRVTALLEYGGLLVPVYSSPCTVTFSKRVSTLALDDPAVSGDNVVLTATVGKDSEVADAPTGSVSFTIAGSSGYSTVVPADVNASGAATATVAVGANGIFTVNAKYNGDSIFGVSDATPKTFKKGMTELQVPVLTTTFSGGSYVYGDTATAPVIRYSSAIPAGEVISTAVYTVRKWNVNENKYGTALTGWSSGADLFFRDTGAYMLTITDSANPNATALTVQFAVSPRPVTFEIGSIITQKPSYATAADLTIAPAAGTPLAPWDSADELGYVSANLIACKIMSYGALQGVTLDGSLPAGVYKIMLKSANFTVANRNKQALYSITLTEGTYQLLSLAYAITYYTTGEPFDGAYGTLSATMTPDGDVTTDLASGEAADQYSTVVITAAPKTGYAVDTWMLDGTNAIYWTGGGSYSLSSDKLTFTMKNVFGSHIVTVSFKQVTRELRYGAAPAEGGTVTVSPSVSSGASVTANVPLTFTATPKVGWDFDSWNVTGATGGTEIVDANGSHSYSVTMPSGALNVVANFQAGSYELEFEDKIEARIGDGDPLTSGAMVPGGSQVTLTVPGYRVGDTDNWYTVSGEQKTVISDRTGVQSHTFTMTEDVAFAVDAAANSYTGHWSAAPAGAGRIVASINGGAAFDENVDVALTGGDILSLTAIPTVGKAFVEWAVDGSANGGASVTSGGNGGTITFLRISDDISVQAVFEDAMPLRIEMHDNAAAENSASYAIEVDGVTWPERSKGDFYVNPGSVIEITANAPLGMFREIVRVNGVNMVDPVVTLTAADETSIYFHYAPISECMVTHYFPQPDNSYRFGITYVQVNGTFENPTTYIDSDHYYPSGSIVTVTAEPQNGGFFEYLVIAKQRSGLTERLHVAETSYSFVLTEDMTIYASFSETEPTPYSMTVNAGEGSVITAEYTPAATATGENTVAVKPLTKAVFRVEPQANHIISGFSVMMPSGADYISVLDSVYGSPNYYSVVKLDGGAWLCTIPNVAHDGLIVASTALPTYAVSAVRTKGGVISVSPTGRVLAGETVSFSIVKEIGYSISSVRVAGTDDTVVDVIDNGDGTYSFTMPNVDVIVSAGYTNDSIPAPVYNVYVTQRDGGMIIATCTENISAETRVDFTVWETAGYTISSVSVAKTGGENVAVTWTNRIMFYIIMPAGDVYVTADYATVPPPTYTLTVIDGEGGGSYTAGAKVSITAGAPPENQVFDKWTLTDGFGAFANASSAATTFTMLGIDAEVTATYKSASSGGGGGGGGGGGAEIPSTQPRPGDDETPDLPGELDDDTPIVPVDNEDGFILDTPIDPIDNDDGSKTLTDGGTLDTSGDDDGKDGVKITMPPGTIITDDNKITFPPGSGGGKISHGNGHSFDVPEDAVIILDDDTPLGYYISMINPFEDVFEDDWFYDNVMNVYGHGLMIGTSTTPMLFGPQASTTRGMVATIVYRMAGSPDVSGLSNPFSDVDAGKWYTDGIMWAAANGIVLGYGDDTYGPEDNITREQLAAILNRYSELRDLSLPETRDYPGFIDDRNISAYARDAVERFFKAAIINGKTDGVLDPRGDATRAELAAMLHRFIIAVSNGGIL
ncbi:MAG: S-layer homology domain-containing protein [Oscillospiraceae bacterium]|nr:S-layer homology domain-containing protein [Oscillospiraceae bacterium]